MPSKACLILRSARKGASRRTQDVDAALRLNSFPASERIPPISESQGRPRSGNIITAGMQNGLWRNARALSALPLATIHRELTISLSAPRAERVP
jgi:hypothetical protein